MLGKAFGGFLIEREKWEVRKLPLSPDALGIELEVAMSTCRSMDPGDRPRWVDPHRFECWVFWAPDMEKGPIAKMKLPARVPTGFHAHWVSGEKLWRA